MRVLSVLAAFAGAALAAPSSKVVSVNARDTTTKNGFTLARPGGVNDLTISKDNTLNGTYHGPKTQFVKPNKFANDATAASVTVSLVNNIGDNVNAYLTGSDSDNKVVFVTSAASPLVYPSSGGSRTPVPVNDPISIQLGAMGSTTNFTVPIAIHSGRIYFSVGTLPFFMELTDAGDMLVQPSVTNPQDPSAGLEWGFVEFTLTDTQLVSNISYVDFVGLILSIQVQSSDGTTQETKGLAQGALEKVCDDLRTQGGVDGFPWGEMCIAASDGTALRALAPQDYASVNTGFDSYWTDYVNSVWANYTDTPLVMNTQADAGNVNCQVTGDVLTCDGDSSTYAKPVANDIWGCNTGPFASVPGENTIHTAIRARLCAAFTRSTLLLDGGSTQPSLPATSYYTVSPTSHYARILHQYYLDGRGYAFSFDDVNPDSGNDNASGTITAPGATVLTVYVGGLTA